MYTRTHMYPQLHTCIHMCTHTPSEVRAVLVGKVCRGALSVPPAVIQNFPFPSCAFCFLKSLGKLPQNELLCPCYFKIFIFLLLNGTESQRKRNSPGHLELPFALAPRTYPSRTLCWFVVGRSGDSTQRKG